MTTEQKIAILNDLGDGEIIAPKIRREIVDWTIEIIQNMDKYINREELRDAILHNWNYNSLPYKDRKGYRLRDREIDTIIINMPNAYKEDKED